MEEEILTLLEDHPLTKQLRAERQAGILRERHVAAAEIERVTREAGTLIPKLQAELALHEAELARYDAERRALQGKVTASRATLTVERLRLDREKAAAEAVLVVTADTRLEEAIIFFRDLHETLRAKRIEQTEVTNRNFITGSKTLRIFSNVCAVTAALVYCRNAIRKLEAMKVLVHINLGRLDELKAGIPDAKEVTEITAATAVAPAGADPLV